jgi:stress-induced morphogen
MASVLRRLSVPRQFVLLQRGLADAGPSSGETHLVNVLRKKFPGAVDIQVADVSGGCGSMYEVYVESPEFKGLRMVQQHRLVTEALSEEIKAMHGVRITTNAVTGGPAPP